MTPELENELRAATATNRNRIIHKAHAAGVGIREIARLVELSPAGVHKIIHKDQP